MSSCFVSADIVSSCFINDYLPYLLLPQQPAEYFKAKSGRYKPAYPYGVPSTNSSDTKATYKPKQHLNMDHIH